MRVDWTTYRPRLTDVGRGRWMRGVRVDPSWGKSNLVTDFDLWYIRGGRGVIQLGSGTAELRPGICIWMRPGAYPVEQNPRDPLSLTFVHFELEDDAGRLLPADAPLPPEYLEPPDAQFAETITRRVVELTWGFSQHGVGHVSAEDPRAVLGRQMLMALLMELDAASDATSTGGGLSRRQRKAVDQAASRIVEFPSEVPTVPELAREAGYSVDHFIRTFRQATGLTPQKFVVQARTRLAQRLLRETEMTVGEIADAAGYRDIYFFSRQFKEVVGSSPSEFRKRIARGGIDGG